MGYFEASCAVVDRPTTLSGPGEFWRKKPPVMVDKKVVKGGFFEPQARWWELPNFIRVFVAGYGAGKTFIGCRWAISMSLQNAPVPFAIISPTFPIAKKTVIDTVSAILAGKKSIYGPKFHYRYNKSEHVFTIYFRGRVATIYVLSGEDPDSLRGPNLAGALIDEPFIQQEAVFTQMIARTRHPDAVRLGIGLTGTPEQLNWGYDLCVGKMKKRYDVGVVQASSRANLALPDGYVDRLVGAFGLTKAVDAYVEGKFVNLAQGAVYYAFDPLADDHHVKHLPIPEGAELGCGMDFNVNPMSAVVFWRAGSHVHIIDELEMPNADTEFLCEELKHRYVYPKTKRTKQVLEYVYPDASGNARHSSSPEGKSDFTYIEAAGFKIKANWNNPKRRDRYNAVNAKFKPRGDKPTLSMEPSCESLIKYLSVYSYELMNKQESMSHLLDAFGYPIAYLFPVDHEELSVENFTGV